MLRRREGLVSKRIVKTGKAPAPIGPYNQAVVVNDSMVYTSGQIPIDPATGAVIKGDIKEQTRRVIENLKAVLEAAGSGMAKVVKTTVYLSDLGKFAGMNEVYAEYFPVETAPARATVQVARLPKDVDVEIDAIAIV